MADLTHETVVSWLRHEVELHSPATANSRRAAILAIWREAAEHELVPPPRKVPKANAPTRVPEAWTIEEVSRILEACRRVPGEWDGCPASTAWEVAISVLWDTACRLGSMLGARVVDVDLDRATWLVPAANIKGRRSDRLYRLHPDTVALIRGSLAEPRDRLFPFPHKPDRVWYHLRKILVAAGLPTTQRDLFHKLRRSAESYAAAARGLAWAAQQVGHSEQVARRHYVAPSIVDTESLCDVLPRPTPGTLAIFAG